MLRRACAAGVSTGNAIGTRGHVLGAGDGELPGAGHGLHDDVGFLDAGGEQFGFCAGEEGFDYCCVVVRGSVGDGGILRRGGTDRCSSGRERCQCGGCCHRASVLRQGP
jgi:hypothetical protein